MARVRGSSKCGHRSRRLSAFRGPARRTGSPARAGSRARAAAPPGPRARRPRRSRRCPARGPARRSRRRSPCPRALLPELADERAVDLDRRAPAGRAATSSRCRSRPARARRPIVAQRLEVAPRGLGRAQQHGLLDLEPQPPRRAARSSAGSRRPAPGRSGCASWRRERLTPTIGPSSPTPKPAALSWQACISVQAPISTISADSSATGMKSAGADITPPGRVPAQQRLVADDRARRRARTIGWKASRSCPSDERPLQRRGGPQPLARVPAQARVEHLDAPAALGLGAVGGGVGVGQQRVRVAAARRRPARSRCSPRAGARCPSTSSGSWIASVRRWPSAIAVRSSMSSQTTTNSSPPSRATVSAGRTVATSRRPSAISSASPAAWP